MELLSGPIDFILHINEYLDQIVGTYGTATYAVLFAIMFAETGLVVTPFLPGDSLLFAAGAVAARGTLSPVVLVVALYIAVVLGDNSNYWLARFLGPRMMREDSRILKREYLDRTNSFFERYGAKTIVIARFVPIVRTFAPFMAGVGAMHYPRFLSYSLMGGALWIAGFIGLGYFFGNIPIVRDHFEIAVLAVIAVSLLPGVHHYVQHKLEARKLKAEEEEPVR